MSNCFVRLFCIPALFTILISSSLLTPDVSFGADNYAAPQTAEVTLAWDPNDPASDGYRLYQRKEGEVYDYNQPCWTGAVTTGTVYNLDWDSTYHFVVRAYEGTFESADSGEVSYVTPSADLTTYSISATAGDHGAISPIGEVDVTNSSDQVFTITPDPGYQVADVQVDGVSVGAINSYTFNNVVAVHTITTSFKMNNNPDDGRITSGLLSLYNFTESQGAVVHDVSGTGIPMDLMIEDLGPVNWINGGGIRIMSPTLIRSVGSAVKLTDAITASGELTIEAWVQPDNTNQGGPARIVTLSQDPYHRNFTLGQEKGSFDVRLRTSDTSTNGMPSLRADNEVRTQLTHVLYTRDAQGIANLYINGNIVLTKMVTGGLTNWDDVAFAIGNELTGDRPWLGELYLVSIYDRSLTGQEVVQNYLAGHASNSDDPNQPQTHSITATSNGNGNVFPSGVFNIEDGASQEITISPENGYQIHDVLVDNQSIGPLNSYLFDSVSGDHSLHAIFLPTSYTISASAGANGSINPIGTAVVNRGEGQTYTITPNTDCQITDVLVDEKSIGAVETYQFVNITSDHTIHASFAVINNASDADKDGILDDQDTFPNDPNEWMDTDDDGVGDNADPCPEDAYNYCTEGRVEAGLLVSYNFNESQGSVIHDVSGFGQPLDLSIADQSAVEWIAGGGLSIVSPTLIRSAGSAVKLTDAITASGELTIEVWVKPDNTNQGGPARIVTLSQDAYYRNFTLGQEKGSFDIRLRTSDTSTNGMPSLRADNEVRTQLTHVLYTRDAQGVANLYINGNIVLTKMVTGGLTNWDDFAFAIGNELTGDRPWLGELYLVSIYDRSLTGQEVVQNYLAGHASNSDDPNQPQTHSITATSNGNGNVFPSGVFNIEDGASQEITISPENGYQIHDVLVDNQSIGPLNSYLFDSVRGDHSLHAIFLPTSYTISASAGSNGSILPAGTVNVEPGASKTYAITPNSGYQVSNVLVDGLSAGVVNAYTFSNVVADHSISATFAPITISHTITATAAGNGSISPAGSVDLPAGDSQTFSMVADSGFAIADVQVDGQSMGALNQYTFSNLNNNHTIGVIFSESNHVNIWIEAEDGDLQYPMEIADDDSAGAGGFIWIPSGTGNLYSPSDSAGYAEYHFEVPEAGDYVVWGHQISNDSSSDSFFVSVDGGSEIAWHTKPGGQDVWTWDVVSLRSAGDPRDSSEPERFSFAAGPHTLKIKQREDGTKLDKILITSQIDLTAPGVPATHSITATAGANGTISPGGAVTVADGTDQLLTITPNSGYQVSGVLVDGVSTGAVNAYTFSNVVADHSISATFAPITAITHTITSSCGPNGAISPAGSIAVDQGLNRAYTITPNSGYQVSGVLVDGVSAGAVNAYTFSNVVADHSISATFAPITITHTITATAGGNGSISPAGSLDLPAGDSQTFSMVADSGFAIADVQVDGQSMGALNQYTFSNLNNNHTIGVIFSESNHVNIWIEAEDGDLQYPMEIADDDSAGAGGFIWVPSGTGNLYSPSDSAGYAEYHFEVPEAGDYVVWGHQISNDSSSDSFFVSVDGGSEIAWHTKPGGQDVWTWDVVSLRSAGDPRDSSEPERFSFAAGPHTLKIKQREDGTKLDKILITNQTDLIEPEPEPDVEVRSMEFGQVELDHHWTRIDLEKEFAAPVVVTGPASLNGAHPAVVRIRNVDSSGFEMRIQEWDYLGGSHPTETVSYLVMEKGSHTLGDGTKIEVATLESSAAGSFHDIVFNQQFNVAPVVMSTISTYNDSAAVTGRIKNITTDGFEYRMQEQELNVQDHAPEMIGYIAWEPSSGALGDVTFLIDQTANVVKHELLNIDFDTPFAASPAFLADMQTTDGGDTANVRYSSKTGVSVDVLIDEEESKNTETNHTSEVVGFMVFIR